MSKSLLELPGFHNRRNYRRALKKNGLQILRQLEEKQAKEKASQSLWQKLLLYLRGEHLKNWEEIELLKKQLKAVGVLDFNAKEKAQLEKIKDAYAVAMNKKFDAEKNLNKKGSVLSKSFKTLKSKLAKVKNFFQTPSNPKPNAG